MRVHSRIMAPAAGHLIVSHDLPALCALCLAPCAPLRASRLRLDTEGYAARSDSWSRLPNPDSCVSREGPSRAERMPRRRWHSRGSACMAGSRRRCSLLPPNPTANIRSGHLYQSPDLLHRSEINQLLGSEKCWNGISRCTTYCTDGKHRSHRGSSAASVQHTTYAAAYATHFLNQIRSAFVVRPGPRTKVVRIWHHHHSPSAYRP